MKPTIEEQKRIFDLIPELRSHTRVFLSQVFFRNLSDEEFSTLWYMPGLEIMVSDNTRAYIEKRRLKLGLLRTKHVHDIIIEQDGEKKI